MKEVSWRECGGCLCVIGSRALPSGVCIPVEFLLTHTAKLLQKLEEVKAKLYTDESIDERVQTTPEEGQTLRGICSQHKCDIIVAIFSSSTCCNRGGQEQDDVVRNLGDEKNSHHSQNDLDGLVPFKVSSLAKSLNDARITEAHNQERKDEGQSNLTGLDANFQLGVILVRKAAGVVAEVCVSHFWDGKDQCHHPDNS